MAGRGKKKQISSKDMAKAEELALHNCQNATIEGIMGWPNGFISKRDDIAKILTQKRQEHKAALRSSQWNQRNNPAMAIFLGKNVLGQADKQEHRLGIDEETRSLLEIIDGQSKNVLPSQEKGQT